MTEFLATIHQVALFAGTSTETAYEVLHGGDRNSVGSGIDARVRAAAAAVGYQRSADADGTWAPAPSIGLVGSAVAAPFAGHLLAGARDAAADYGIGIILANTSSDTDLEDWDLQALLDRDPVGVIYTSHIHRIIGTPAALESVPHVLLNSSGPDPGTRSVVIDHCAAAYTAVNELLRHGHRRIGYIADHDNNLTVRARLEGHLAALAAGSASQDPAFIAGDEPTSEGGLRAAAKLLDLQNPPTAVLCFNDRMAMGAYQAAADRGLRIPEQLSVIGFDDLELISDSLRPPLTTLHLPYYEMGRCAVYTLLDILKNDPTHRTHQTALACRLIRRASVGPPAG